MTSCGNSAEDGPVAIAVIAEPGSLYDAGVRLSVGAQHLRGATTEGLVTLDQTGRILPGVAERWHVSPDGLYYTFKLRATSWPDEKPLTAEDVRNILRTTVDQLDGTTLGFDLAKLQEIRAMTGRVIELRLSSPMPEFLRLLAQPELGLVKNGSGSGPMVLARDDGTQLAKLDVLPPEQRGMPVRENWENFYRPLTLRALPANQAVAEFNEGNIDLLLNGTLNDLPLVDLGPLSRGTIQVDPALGIFGLVFLNADGVLSDPARREALSMAIDREALIEPFGIAGWQPASVIVSSAAGESGGYPTARWIGLSLEERQSIAANRISEWENTAGSDAAIRVKFASGPGNDRLFEQLQKSWQTVGVETTKVNDGEPADLELRDRLARYSSPRWFLNQFNCELASGLCSARSDELVQASLDIRDPAAKGRILADAHAALFEEEVFIPFGAPVRWALVRGTIAAYEPNPWGLHPLFPLSQTTN